VVDFVEICNVCIKKVIIEAAKRKINSDKVCHSYSDLNFGVTFFGTQCIYELKLPRWAQTAHRPSNDLWCILSKKNHALCYSEFSCVVICNGHNDKLLSYRRETALQGGLVMAKSERL